MTIIPSERKETASPSSLYEPPRCVGVETSLIKK